MDIGTSERKVSWIFVHFKEQRSSLTYPDIDGYRNFRDPPTILIGIRIVAKYPGTEIPDLRVLYECATLRTLFKRKKGLRTLV
jgi:hypothetical protein